MPTVEIATKGTTQWRARLALLGIRDSNGCVLAPWGRWSMRNSAPLRWVPTSHAAWQIDGSVGVCDRLEARDGALWVDVVFNTPPDSDTVQAMLDRRLRPAFDFAEGGAFEYTDLDDGTFTWTRGTVTCLYLSETPSFGVHAWFEPAASGGAG